MKILRSSFIVILVLFVSCNHQNKTIPENKKEQLIKIIDSIYALDQSSRQNFNKLDSRYGMESNFWMASRALKKQKLGSQYSEYQADLASLKALMNNIDDSNTKLLIGITKKYGFPTNHRLGVYKSKAYFIFVHAPKKYVEEIRELINDEYQYKRLNEYKKDYIFWHLNGRKGIPPMAGPNGSSVYIH